MTALDELLQGNKNWAKKVKKYNPAFFKQLSEQQLPEILWIGCADSRVPASEIVDVLPGNIFVHRNLANVVVHTDLNCLSVIQYAVEVLQIKHIIVCGHYDCGGIKAALESQSHGLIDNWLRHIKDVYRFHQHTIEAIEAMDARVDKLCELNVMEQVANVCHTTILQKAWQAKRKITVQGWIYNINDGILKDLQVSISGLNEISRIQRLKQ